MEATRPAIARIAAGGAALLVVAVIVLLVGRTDSRLDGLVSSLAVLGVLITVAALALGWSSFGVLAAVLEGAAFCASRFESPHTLDLAAVALAPALLLLAELVSWSADERVRVRGGASPSTRAATIAAVVVATGAMTAVIASIATLPVGDALVLAALGVVAVVVVTLALLAGAEPG
jgi:hypothetical protein